MSFQNQSASVETYINNQKLHLSSRPIELSEINSILIHIETNPNTIDNLKIENSPIREIDFLDLMNYLSNYQKTITKVQISRFNFAKSSVLFEQLRLFLLSLDSLTELDLSGNNLNSVHYGLILNIVKRSSSPLTLNLSGCFFSVYDQEIFFKTLPKTKNIKEIILENTSFTKNHVQILTSQLKQPSRVSNLYTSMLRSDLGKSTIDQKKKSKFALDFSTVAKDKSLPRILIRCGCTRTFAPSEMFICTTCAKSMCGFCSKSCVAIAKCFNCSRSIGYSNELKVKISKECKSCIECPVCKNSLTFVDTNSKYFACKFCLWSSMAFQGSDERGDELASGMIKHTFLLGKEHENYLTELFYNYKDMMNEKSKNNLKEVLDSHIRSSNINASGIRMSVKKEPTIKRESSYLSRQETNIKRANLIKDTLDKVVDLHSINPIFAGFYSKGFSKTDKAAIIANYKVNPFNLHLYHRLPIKVYRRREDYYILSKLMRAYVSKSCRKCSKTLVNYEMVGGNAAPITSSFLYEMNPSYAFKAVKLLLGENRTYRMTLVINNYTGYQYGVELKCKKNCRFAGINQIIKHTFEFNKNVINITSLKADRNSFIDETALTLELDFEVDLNEASVVLELTQTKTMNLKTTLTIIDDILIDFGPPSKFLELFE